MIDTPNNRWHPDRCPVTLKPFFCWIEHPERGLVPTYGGLFDSWTLAEPCGPLEDGMERRDVEYTSERYDHDAGEWKEDETLGLRCVTDELLFRLEDQLAATQRECRLWSKRYDEMVITASVAGKERDEWRECAEELHTQLVDAIDEGRAKPATEDCIAIERFTELKNRQTP